MGEEARAALVAASATHVPGDLARRGIEVHVCHGTGSLYQLGEDLHRMVAHLRQQHPSRPQFLLCEGAGGVVGALYAMGHAASLDGLICASIALELPMSAMRMSFVRMLANAMPRWRLLELIRAGDRLRASVARLSSPLLVLHGAADRVTRASGSEFLHQHAGSRDKTLLIFEGYHHDLLGGAGNELVVEKVIRWIDARLNAPTQRTQIGIEYINDT